MPSDSTNAQHCKRANAMAGNIFMQVFTEMKRDHQSIVLAVQKGNEGEIISNPDSDFRVEGSDHLIVISGGRPQ